ncbi:RUN domain-containing protein 1 [Paragonimus kellicotti]|nr:RUN domain-containing protein 1 [Paragonimus kellicotti]
MIRDDCTHSNSPEESFSIVDEDGKPKERWTPLGANSSPEPVLSRTKEEFHSETTYTNSRAFSNLVLENERMNRALMALTSHFVQFRLGQVVNAESGCREDMLKSLEQFASRGIPDLQLCTPPSKSTGEQKEPPTQAMLGKQRLVLEELTRKLELDIKNLEQLSNDELMQVVDLAVHQFLNPVKVNEKLVEQLKTQIVDLERFIDFLHVCSQQNWYGNSLLSGPHGSGACSDTLAKVLAEFKRTHQRHAVEPDSDTAPFETVSPGIQLGHSRHINTETNHINGAGVKNAARREYLNGRPVFSDKSSRDRTITLLQRAMAILHIFTSTQFGELADWKFHKKNVAKHTTSDNSRSSAAVERAKLQHWGTVRARLEVAVNVVLQKVNLLRSFQSEHFNRSLEQTSCIMKPTTSVDELDTSTYECRSVLAEKDRSRRPVRRSHTLSLQSDSIAVGQTLGTKISLPVQRLHEACLRTMLDHGNPTCVTSAAYSSGLRTVRNSTSSGPNTVEPDHTISDTEEFLCSEAHRMVIRAVRRHLCPALRDLIEHGLLKKPLYSISEESSGLLQPRNFLLRPILGCFSSRKREPMEDGMDLVEEDTDYEAQQMYSNARKRSSYTKHSGPHAWHVLLKFYHLKVCSFTVFLIYSSY